MKKKIYIYIIHLFQLILFCLFQIKIYNMYINKVKKKNKKKTFATKFKLKFSKKKN